MDITAITEKQVRERVQQMLPEGLVVHKLTFFHSKGNMRVAVELDKPADPYGSVNIGECENYSRALRDSLDEVEKTTGVNLNYSLEVSSAGAERELLSIADVERFKALPMQVTFTAETGKILTEVLSAKNTSGETIEFIMADCKANRRKYSQARLRNLPPYNVPWGNIKKIRLHLDI